jgi:hypothetical protein
MPEAVVTPMPNRSEQIAQISSEHSSEEVGRIAGKALRDPLSLTRKEILALAASVLTQRPNRKRKTECA